MNIDTRRVGTVDVITPSGPLVDEDANTFVETLQTRLESPNPRLVLDMSEVPYMDSRGLEGLVETSYDLQQRGGRLRLASTTATCREILELTGQAQQFDFFDETKDAVRSFL